MGKQIPVIPDLSGRCGEERRTFWIHGTLILMVFTQSVPSADGKETSATAKSEAPTLKWGNGKSSLLEKADLKTSMAIPQTATVETTHTTAPKTQDDPENIVVCVCAPFFN